MNSATGLKTEKNLELVHLIGKRRNTTVQDMNVTPIVLHKVDTLFKKKIPNILIVNGATSSSNHSTQKTKNDMFNLIPFLEL